MRFVLPRTIIGNLGDISSRWGIVKALESLGVEGVVVFRNRPEDLPSNSFDQRSYHGFRNLPPNTDDVRILRNADVVLWAAGLDLQDDSSLAKLLYLWMQFHWYRLMGLRIWCVFQGAGPMQTSMGRMLARSVLGSVDRFIARDPASAQLVSELSTHPIVNVGYDGIFLPGFENEISEANSVTSGTPLRQDFIHTPPVIGLNLRQWYHFTSGWLPYQLAQEQYRQRSEARMASVISAMVQIVTGLRRELNAVIVLISAYQKGAMDWEDDRPWLEHVHSQFQDDPNVQLLDEDLSVPEYFRMMSQLDLMIGMRLHSSLTALRFHVPSINISYTLKGGDIYRHLGLGEDVFDLESVQSDPGLVVQRAADILAEYPTSRSHVRQVVTTAIETNYELLGELVHWD